MGRRIFDAHLHIIDPRFPLIENQGYLPPPFPVNAYNEHAKRLNIQGGAVVSGSFQGQDQSYLVEALNQLGPNFVGVTQLPVSVTDHEIATLDTQGVRAIRFNVKRGGSATLNNLTRLAQRVFDLAGWHSEFYIDSAELEDLLPRLKVLPKISIDHLGLSQRGFPKLLMLVERGARVKATGFGRINLNLAEALVDIYQCNPESLMFGTDLPSTRAKRPFADSDINILLDALGDSAAEQILWDNAANWYQRPTH